MALHPASILALALGALVALSAVVSTAAAVPQFFDPCHEWGVGSGQDDGTIALDDECPSRTGTSQTRTEAILNLVAIQGVLLLAAGCIARGALRLDRTWTGVGATLIAIMVPPFGLGVLWIPILTVAVSVFVSATAYPVVQREVRVRERVTAYALAAVGVLLLAVYLTVAGGASFALIVAGIGVAGLVVTTVIDRTKAPGRTRRATMED
ncbi:MAG: hypothetical protein KY455_08285 [Euryarchaeota archaeon]|nr:hypothetical protein [Euryarchaeota archaeon]